VPFEKNNIPVVILAGGLGTRISEETDNKPKPMVRIGEKPILWHVMNIFAEQGFRKFIIATGYKSEVIESWAGEILEPWDVKVLNTGLESQTADRVRKCMESFPEDRYFVTYGDGLGNVDLRALLRTHLDHKKIATVTAVRPPARFGVLDIEGSMVTHFGEKDQASSGWINGGFFVFEREIASYISANSKEVLEANTLPRLARDGELVANLHFGFWKPMDTLREKKELEALIECGAYPWLTLYDY
jgi:glucose-1-phosphate cytidylyltransferase